MAMTTARCLSWLAAGAISATAFYLVARHNRGRGYANGYIEATSGQLRRVADARNCGCPQRVGQDRRS